MSVAFTKEESSETASETQLPHRPVSQHPNLVTPEGRKALEAEHAAAKAALDAASAIEDVNERRRQSATPLRDLTYLAERLRTAEVVAPPGNADAVAFGSTVTITRDDGRTQRYRIVGEDEADPRSGTISYVSPMARALFGREVGDDITVGDHDFEIIEIA